MPLRSPKMKVFIFGFQRFVWWPKCTPASSSSFIAIAAKLTHLTAGLPACATALTFAELEAFACASHSVLLAFLRARVAGQEPFALQRLAQLEVVGDQRAGDAEAHRAGLAGHAAAGDRGQDVELVDGLGQHHRGLDLRAQRFGGEERFEGAAIDGQGAVAGPEKHAGGRCLAATGSVILHCCCHVTRPRAWTVSAPCAGDPDRRTLSACGTSLRPSWSWAACRAPRLRRAFPACARAPAGPALRAARLRSRCAAGRSSDLPCGR